MRYKSMFGFEKNLRAKVKVVIYFIILWVLNRVDTVSKQKWEEQLDYENFIFKSPIFIN